MDGVGGYGCGYGSAVIVCWIVISLLYALSYFYQDILKMFFYSRINVLELEGKWARWNWLITA